MYKNIVRTGGNTRGEKVLVVFVRLLECEMQNKFLCMQTEKYNVKEKIGYWRWWRRACVPSLTLQIKYTIPHHPHPLYLPPPLLCSAARGKRAFQDIQLHQPNPLIENTSYAIWGQLNVTCVRLSENWDEEKRDYWWDFKHFSKETFTSIDL